MISVEEIFERIEQKKQNDKAKKEQRDKAKSLPQDSDSDNKRTPNTIDNYVVPDFNINKSNMSGKKPASSKVLSKILTFVHSVQKIRVRNACTIMPIAVTSNEYLSIWGSEKNISRAVDTMIRIGLIGEHDETYRHHAPALYEDENRSKTYKYFYENELKFIAYCEQHKIKEFNPENVTEYSKKVKKTIAKVDSEYKEFKIEDVIFSSNLKLMKPLGVSESDFETYLTYCLYSNYPEFKFHQMKVDEINENYYKDYPEFAIRFKPNFTWHINKKNPEVKKVVKIGIRATNSFCNKEEEERDKILEEYGLNLEWDITSSVPRLTLSLNTGEWVDESIDIYELINNEFDPEFHPISKEAKNKRRKAIKKLHMSGYFEEHSDLILGRNVWNHMVKDGANKYEVYDVAKRLRDAITKAEGGKLYGSEIFYVESCVYLMTLYDLFSSGHMAWLVYDAFYSKGESEQEYFELMIKNGVRLNFEAFYERSKFKKKS